MGDRSGKQFWHRGARFNHISPCRCNHCSSWHRGVSIIPTAIGTVVPNTATGLWLSCAYDVLAGTALMPADACFPFRVSFCCALPFLSRLPFCVALFCALSSALLSVFFLCRFSLLCSACLFVLSFGAGWGACSL